MPASGVPPKPPGQRARRNKDPIPMRVMVSTVAAQPKLPAGRKWPKATRDWWAMWAASPLSAEFTANDWSELLDTALLHAAYWQGDLRYANELRQRVANFGATPADRAKLRITFATAEKAEAGAEKPKPAGYAGLRAVDAVAT